MRGRTVGDAELEGLRGSRLALRARLTALMDEHGLDLWASPSAVGGATQAGLDSTGDPVMNLPWTRAGLPGARPAPAASPPTGCRLGLQLAGRFGVRQLLAWAGGMMASPYNPNHIRVKSAQSIVCRSPTGSPITSALTEIRRGTCTTRSC